MPSTGSPDRKVKSVGWMSTVTPSTVSSRAASSRVALQEIAVEHPVLALEADEDEVVVGAERLPELQVERRLGLALGEEGLEVVVEADLCRPPTGQRRENADGDEDPAGTGFPALRRGGRSVGCATRS